MGCSYLIGLFLVVIEETERMVKEDVGVLGDQFEELAGVWEE